MKRRHEFYLDADVSEQLNALAAKPGASKTAIMSDALRAYLERRGANELDQRFRARLDRLSMQLGRIERDQQVVAEMLALFVRFQLTVTAPIPDGDRAARALGQARYESFLQQVSHRLAGSAGTIEDVLSHQRSSESAS
jgi:predicted transcriptional regulator